MILVLRCRGADLGTGLGNPKLVVLSFRLWVSETCAESRGGSAEARTRRPPLTFWFLQSLMLNRFLLKENLAVYMGLEVLLPKSIISREIHTFYIK